MLEAQLQRLENEMVYANSEYTTLTKRYESMYCYIQNLRRISQQKHKGSSIRDSFVNEYVKKKS